MLLAVVSDLARCHTSSTVFSGQKNHAVVMKNLIIPAIQRSICILPVALPIYPPTMAPTKMQVKASALLFLLALLFSGAARFGSEAMSQSMDVRTTLGISDTPNALLPMICPAAWKLSNEIGISSFHTISALTTSSAPFTTPACIMVATTKIITDCSANDVTSVARRSGPEYRARREKKKQPMQKQAMDVKDLAQPYGFEVVSEVEGPRPRKIVFPVCMLTNVP